MPGTRSMRRVWRLIALTVRGRHAWRHRTLRQNQPMPKLGELTDDELFAGAHEWRRRALRGEKDARGMAHTLEAEIRRRVGISKSSYAALDTRPLEARARKPWWRL